MKAGVELDPEKRAIAVELTAREASLVVATLNDAIDIRDMGLAEELRTIACRVGAARDIHLARELASALAARGTDPRARAEDADD